MDFIKIMIHSFFAWKASESREAQKHGYKSLPDSMTGLSSIKSKVKSCSHFEPGNGAHDARDGIRVIMVISFFNPFCRIRFAPQPP